MNFIYNSLYKPINSYNYQDITNKIDELRYNKIQTLAKSHIELDNFENIYITPSALSNPCKLPNLFHVVNEKIRYDFFFARKFSKKLYIIFSGAKQENSHLPLFKRQSWNALFDGDCLYVSDPLFYKYKDLELAWYLGDREVNIQKVLFEYILKIIEKSSYEKIFTYGSSGGGFAALKFSDIIPSCAIAINPQIYVNNYPYFSNFLFILQERDPHFFDNRIKLNFNPLSTYFIIQNKTDTEHMRRDYLPFLKQIGMFPKYGLQKKDNIYTWLYHSFGGHNSQENYNILQFILFFANYFIAKQPSNRFNLDEIDNLAITISELWAESTWLKHQLSIKV